MLPGMVTTMSNSIVRRDHRETPRRALLVAVAAGQVPPWYLRETFEMRNTDLRLALVEATHLDPMGDC